MKDLLLVAYPWIKALHVLSVILWMGAQLTLPLLLAVHRGLPPASKRAAMLANIERDLIRWLLNPAIVAAFVLGGLMVYVFALTAGSLPHWLVVKLVLVLLLSAVHGMLVRELRHVAGGGGRWRAATCRWVQWLDIILLALVVCLVVIKPQF